MPHEIRAPWTDSQVAALNRFQCSGRFHPFTCGGDHSRDRFAPDLIATTDGWVCPDAACGYRQDWAHSIMAE